MTRQLYPRTYSWAGSEIQLGLTKTSLECVSVIVCQNLCAWVCARKMGTMEVFRLMDGWLIFIVLPLLAPTHLKAYAVHTHRTRTAEDVRQNCHFANFDGLWSTFGQSPFNKDAVFVLNRYIRTLEAILRQSAVKIHKVRNLWQTLSAPWVACVCVFVCVMTIQRSTHVHIHIAHISLTHIHTHWHTWTRYKYASSQLPLGSI